jgi:hypothetical protein
MTLVEIHGRLSNTASLFIAVLTIWAVYLALRARAVDGSWLGAAVIAELLIAAQGALGAVLYVQGHGMALPRPFLHILYGIVSLITLPASYTYFGSIENDRVKTLALAATCAFLWGILQRSVYTAHSIPVDYINALFHWLMSLS